MKIALITIGLLIVLSLTLFFWGQKSFSKRLLAAQNNLINETDPVNLDFSKPITEADLQKLPGPVQKWLQSSGALGKKRVKLTRLKQSGSMRLKPDQKEWTESQSEQIINLEKPSFVWNVKMSLSGLPVLGMDQFAHGHGSILITLLGLIPVVNAGPHPKINQSALQRFLGEIVWTPSAALIPFIEWKPLNERSAQARMTVDGVTGEATFYFSDSGDLEKFVALRFKDMNDAQPLEWHADVREIRVFHGVRIPSELEATWILPQGPFTWFKFKIDDISYE